jgi:hypothetical protein
MASKQPEPLKNHHKAGEYNAMYFNNANRSDHMILTSQKFYYGPGRYRKNMAYEPNYELLPSKISDKWKQGRPNLGNYNSVRVNSAHKKFVSIELFSTSHFALRFNRFYCEDLKGNLQKIPNCRFLMDF